MKENLLYHMVLGAYLTTADRHYLDGRILRFSNSAFGAGMPLWLAAEQMIKLYIVQTRVENKSLSNVSHSLTYNPLETNIDLAFKVVSKSFKNLSPHHKVDPLLKEMEGILNINSYKKTLEKVHELYERRYFVNRGTSIPSDTFPYLDEFYFKLRSHLSKNIPRSLIDEIAYQKKFGTGHPLRNFTYAYYDNPFFRAKEHPVVYQSLPDGKIIANDGVADAYVTTVPSGIPVHVAVKKLDY